MRAGVLEMGEEIPMSVESQVIEDVRHIAKEVEECSEEFGRISDSLDADQNANIENTKDAFRLLVKHLRAIAPRTRALANAPQVDERLVVGAEEALLEAEEIYSRVIGCSLRFEKDVPQLQSDYEDEAAEAREDFDNLIKCLRKFTDEQPQRELERKLSRRHMADALYSGADSMDVGVELA
jgi:hypothetical protein